MWELPPKAELIAWSDKTGVEMFKYGDHMMGIQGHPEYTKDILLNLIDRVAKLEYILVNIFIYKKRFPRITILARRNSINIQFGRPNAKLGVPKSLSFRMFS